MPPYVPNDSTALVSPNSNKAADDASQAHFGQPLAVTWLRAWLRPEISPEMELAPNAFYMAGWVGLLITGLNMMPISQLDGGHVTYGLWGPESRWIGRTFLFTAIGYILFTENYSWTRDAVVGDLPGHRPSADGERSRAARTLALGTGAWRRW